MNKETRKLIREKIGKSSIPDEIKLMYAVASACQCMVEHCDSRIRSVFASFGVKTSGNDLLSGLNDYSKAVKMASARFYDRIEGQIIGATFDIGGAESYDGFNGDATDLYACLCSILTGQQGTTTKQKKCSLCWKKCRLWDFSSRRI